LSLLRYKSENDELSKLKPENTRLTDENEELDRERTSLEDELAKLRTELASAKLAKVAAEKKATAFETKLERTAGELVSTKKTLEAHEQTALTLRLEAEQRFKLKITETQNALHVRNLESLEEQKETLTAEADRRLQETQRHHDEATAELKAQIQEEQTLKNTYMRQVVDQKAVIRDLQAQLLQKDTKIATLANDLERLVTDHQVELKALMENLDEARAARRQKELDFNELMDLKIGLHEQLNTYHQMLGDAESKLGIEPTNKRKGDSSDDDDHETPSKKARTRVHQAEEEQETVFIESLEVEDEMVMITNPLDTDVPLKGWTVVSKSCHVTYRFEDDFVLAAGTSVTLWAGKVNAEREDEMDGVNDILWTKRCVGMVRLRRPCVRACGCTSVHAAERMWTRYSCICCRIYAPYWTPPPPPTGTCSRTTEPPKRFWSTLAARRCQPTTARAS
jgi:hypothetical protein